MLGDTTVLFKQTVRGVVGSILIRKSAMHHWKCISSTYQCDTKVMNRIPLIVIIMAIWVV